MIKHRDFNSRYPGMQVRLNEGMTEEEYYEEMAREENLMAELEYQHKAFLSTPHSKEELNDCNYYEIEPGVWFNIFTNKYYTEY